MKIKDSQMNSVLDAIAGYVVGCPDVAIKSAIRIATEDYINDIGGIEERYSQNLKSDDGLYHIDAPFGGRIVSVYRVTVNGVAQNKSCYSVVIDDSGCATIGLRDFIRSRVRTSGLRVGVVAYWVPTEQTPELPPMWWSKHNRAIRYAALKMLLSQVGNPWGNEATAVRFADEYYKCVQDALVSRRIEDGGQLNCFDPSSTFVVGGF